MGGTCGASLYHFLRPPLPPFYDSAPGVQEAALLHTSQCVPPPPVLAFVPIGYTASARYGRTGCCASPRQSNYLALSLSLPPSFSPLLSASLSVSAGRALTVNRSGWALLSPITFSARLYVQHRAEFAVLRTLTCDELLPAWLCLCLSLSVCVCVCVSACACVSVR